MKLRIGNAPCSWGVEFPSAPTNPPWEKVLDQTREAGFTGIELGPVGYFPENPEIFGEALKSRGLQLTAGVVFRPFHDPEARDEVLDGAHKTFRSLAAHGATTGVLIDSIAAERSVTAGRPEEAPRLEPQDWRQMMERIRTIAKIGAEEYGLTIALHGHAAGYIEYKDEIEKTLDDIDENILKLCIDTGHCLYAGFDPLNFYLQHRERTCYLHFKDIDPAVKDTVISERINFYDAIARGLFCNLGKGLCNFNALFDAMRKAGYSGWGTVEQECDPATQTTLADAIHNHKYLRSML